MNKWTKLDNAAIIFPSVAKAKNSTIYRVSTVLKEAVLPVRLQQALDMTVKRYPMMTMRIHKGLFWRYMEYDDEPLRVKREDDYPCHPLQDRMTMEALLKVFYYQRRISVEVFHAISDGSGAMEFLKTLVFEYLRILGKAVEPEGKVKTATEEINPEELEDSFHRYYMPGRPPKIKNTKAYQITGTYFEPYGNNVTQGVVSASALRQIAKKQGATLTEFLLALLMYTIYRQSSQDRKDHRPIKVSVPVNLRTMFPSKTLRNFFSVALFEISSRQEQSLFKILCAIKEQSLKNYSKKVLQEAIIRNINLEKIKIARFIPLPIKDIIVKNRYFLYNDKLRTCTMTNLGRVELPQTMTPYVERMEVVFYPTANNPLNCGLCTVNDNMTISFSRTIRENRIIGDFFRYLSQEYGLEVKIYSNEWGISD